MDPSRPGANPLVVFGLSLGFIGKGTAYDCHSPQRIHPVYLWGERSCAPPYPAVWLRRADTWRAVVEYLNPEQTGVATECYTCYDPDMPRTITQRELRNDSAAVLRDVQAGQIIIVTRNGMPVAELRPVAHHRFVPRAPIAEAARRAPRVDLARLRADLDAVVSPLADD